MTQELITSPSIPLSREVREALATTKGGYAQLPVSIPNPTFDALADEHCGTLNTKGNGSGNGNGGSAMKMRVPLDRRFVRRAP